MTDVRARTSPGARIGLRYYLLCGLGLVLALLTTSCGNTVFVPGTPIVTLSATPGRFQSYIVNLDQIYLTRNDGNTFVLPATSTTGQRVDLAHLDRYPDLLQAPAVEEGTFVSITFQIDYSSAYIAVDVGGQAIVANPIDPSTGSAAGLVTVTAQFDPNHQLVINNQNSTPLALDIDLEASNIVAINSSGVRQTTVKPFWTATAVPAYDKPVFARGLYVIADTKNNNFIMNVRPLHDEVNSPFGALTVNVTDQTYYQINGTTYVGAAGLAAIAGLQNAYANLPMAAYGPNTPSPFGSLNTIQPSMTATQVYVGTSLESTIEDQISGIVSSISGDTVNVTGSFIDRTGTNYVWVHNIPVTLGPNTIISIDGVAGVTPSIKSISVGQFIAVTGQETTDSKGNLTGLDATGSSVPGAQVRLQNTRLWGTVSSLNSGNLVLDPLWDVENLYAQFYLNFAGTGTSSAADASSTNYQVATGSINLSGVATGALVKVDGLANAFGSGPPYFTASAVTPATALPSRLVLEMPAGTTTGINNFTASSFMVNLADSNLDNAVVYSESGNVTTAYLLSVNPPPGNVLTITYNTGNSAYPPLYGVGSVALGESLFSDPTAFATKANSLIPANAVYKIVATGQYDATTGTFAATNITINLK
jgi:hypothetical protein